MVGVLDDHVVDMDSQPVDMGERMESETVGDLAIVVGYSHLRLLAVRLSSVGLALLSQVSEGMICRLISITYFSLSFLYWRC